MYSCEPDVIVILRAAVCKWNGDKQDKILREETAELVKLRQTYK